MHVLSIEEVHAGLKQMQTALDKAAHFTAKDKVTEAIRALQLLWTQRFGGLPALILGRKDAPMASQEEQLRRGREILRKTAIDATEKAELAQLAEEARGDSATFLAAPGWLQAMCRNRDSKAA